MRVIVLTLIAALAALGQHRGGGFGGGGRGFGGGGRAGGGFGGGRSSGFHAGYGGGFRGSPGFGGYRGWGGAGLRSYGWRGGYARSGYLLGGYYGGFYGGFGYLGAPFISTWPSIGFYYDSFAYSPYGYGYYGGPAFAYPYVPNTTVTVVTAAPPDRPSYPIAVYTEPRRPATASAPALYLVALKDGTIWAASDYYIQDGKLNIITRQHDRKEFSLSQIDRSFTEELNRERGVDLRLPDPARE